MFPRITHGESRLGGGTSRWRKQLRRSAGASSCGKLVAYNSAKRASNRAVYHAKNEAEKVALQKIDPRSADVYRLAKQMRRDNQDLMGEKPIKNDEGLLSLDVDAKKEAWKEHYERLLNVEFPWKPDDLSVESPVEGPSEPITLEMITKAINKMASGPCLWQSSWTIRYCCQDAEAPW